MVTSTGNSLLSPFPHLPTLKLSKWHELGNFSNFDKSCPNSIESDPGPFESIIMHFWLKVATQEVSDHSMNDPLPIQKNGYKNFFDQKMVQMALVEIFASRNRPFWSDVVEIFSSRTRWGSKALVKIFRGHQTHFWTL